MQGEIISKLAPGEVRNERSTGKPGDARHVLSLQF